MSTHLHRLKKTFIEEKVPSQLIFFKQKFQSGFPTPRHKHNKTWLPKLPRILEGKLNISTQTGQTDKFLDLKSATPSIFTFRRISLSPIITFPVCHKQLLSQDCLIKR